MKLNKAQSDLSNLKDGYCVDDPICYQCYTLTNNHKQRFSNLDSLEIADWASVNIPLFVF